MIIKSLTIDGKKFDFDTQSNIISSEKNSVGKTTLIRLILFTLGYSIPSTKGMNFSKLQLTLSIETKDKSYYFERKENMLTIVDTSNNKSTVLDSNYNSEEIKSYVYSISEPKILDNILAMHYFDQEKGWTLLNRGIAIGSIKFSIESFLEGLDDTSKLSELNETLRTLKKEQHSYKQIQSILKSKEESEDNDDNIDWTSIDQLQNELRSLKMEIKKVQNSLNRLIKIRSNNDKLISLIEEMDVRIRTKDGLEESVTKANIIGFSSNQEFITARIAREKKVLSDLSKKNEHLIREFNSKSSLVDVNSQLNRFNSAVSNLHIPSSDLDSILKDYSKRLKNVRMQIKKILSKSQIVDKLYDRIIAYAKILGVDDMIDRNSDFIFTSNLKRYSGANLHLLVFAYRLALLKEVQIKYDQTYPIILDSPFSGELDFKNFSYMMELIDQEFPSNQLIVATIYDVDEYYNWSRKITIHSQLLESNRKNIF